MKLGRIGFIVGLGVLFVSSFIQMNLRYDPLARYQYAETVNRQVLQHLPQEAIDYIIEHQIAPERFEKYVDIEGFNVQYLSDYEWVSQYNPNLAEVVGFVNAHRDWLSTQAHADELFNVYGFEQIASYLNQGVPGIVDAQLVVQPMNPLLVIKEQQTLLNYRPKNLVPLEGVPTADVYGDVEGILIDAQVSEPLKELCAAIGANSEYTCDDLVVVRGYTDVEEQNVWYNSAILEYGIDNVTKYVAKPTQSEFQLGTSIAFYISKLNQSEFAEAPQTKWLAENAYKYGFIVRYPLDKETITKHAYQPLVIRYVGKENAKYLFDKNLTLEQEANNNEKTGSN